MAFYPDHLTEADADDLYLNESANLSDLDDVPTARTNLGLVAGGAGDIWVEKAGDTVTGEIISIDDNPITFGSDSDVSIYFDTSLVQQSLRIATGDGQIIIGNASTISSVDPVVVVSRNVNDSKAGNGHCFSDSSQIDRMGTIAYNSFDCRTTVSGANNYDHFASHQDGMVLGTTGTTTDLYSFISVPVVNSGTLTNRYGFIAEEVAGTGTVVNNIGLRIESLTAGTTLNRAIWTGRGEVRFGDYLTIADQAKTTGTPYTFNIAGAAHTGITGETTGGLLNFSATKTWGDGTAISLQREVRVQAPTYASSVAKTFTNAATLHIDKAPVAGSNVTITNPYSLFVDAGASRFDGDVFIVNNFDLALGGASNSTALANIRWDTTDANANMLKIDLPTQTATVVPVASFGVGINGVDLTLLNGTTAPTVAVWALDRASAMLIQDDGTNTVLKNTDSNAKITIPSNPLQTAGRYKKNKRITSANSPYSVEANIEELFCDTDGGAITVNLPAGVNERALRIINCGSSANDVTVTPNGVELLEGVNGSVTLVDAQRYYISYETTEGWW